MNAQPCYDTNLDTVIHGDALEVLRGMPDNSVDAIVTDPPAGISFMGRDWDNPDKFPYRDRSAEAKRSGREEKVAHYGLGYQRGNRVDNLDYSKKGRDAFIHFLQEVMTEALRVLKPGGHALVWALPRTSHWTALALEDAGFEVREKLYHIFGSGFPKSHDISKAIDRMQGVEREVIAIQSNHRNRPLTDKWDKSAKIQEGSCHRGHSGNLEAVTAPATPEAQQWQGWGTATKPAVEEWILVRKPLAEKSIAANVLTWGTGGINVDKCRVQTSAQDAQAMERCNTPGSGRFHAGGGQIGTFERSSASPKLDTTQGRFPSHLLLSHSIWCVPTGTSHSCSPDCPIRALDEQSGVRGNGYRPNKCNDSKSSMFGLSQGNKPYNDTGGASRYFQNFPPDDFTPFAYHAKASRRERNAGCEGLPSSRSDYRPNDPNENSLQTRLHGSINAVNSHPTVKPLALMRWLIRLITPPGGIVLDCFAGSGSTCVAAIHEGVHFIGIEQSSEYVAIAEARIAHAIAQHKGGSLPPPQERIEPSIAQQEYDCAPDCPIRILGEQSGERRHGGPIKTNGVGMFHAEKTLATTSQYNDSGNASRYFQQFPPDSLFADHPEIEEAHRIYLEEEAEEW